MILGIGTDITSVKRITGIFAEFGERFAEKILTDFELSEFHTSKYPEAFLAKRFAIKEAAAKALGTGFRQGVSYQDIGLTHTSLGKPELTWQGRAREVALNNGMVQSHVSVSDEQEFVIAFVTLEKQG